MIALALLRRFWYWGVLALALGWGVVTCRQRDAARFEAGVLQGRAETAHAQADTAKRQLDSAKATQPRVDTLWRGAAHISTAQRDSLALARTAADSLARLLAIRDADTETIRSCSVARLTCDERALAAEQLADARLRELKARIATPAIRRRWGVGGTLGFGTTYDLATKRFGTGPSATVGVTFSF